MVGRTGKTLWEQGVIFFDEICIRKAGRVQRVNSAILSHILRPPVLDKGEDLSQDVDRSRVLLFQYVEVFRDGTSVCNQAAGLGSAL